MERHSIILAEFHTYLSDEVPVYEFMYQSDKASALREERHKAIKEGKKVID